MIGLTARQRETLDIVRDAVATRGYPPTLRELGKLMGIGSTNGVTDHLAALQRKGYLVREEMLSRSMRLTHKAHALYSDGVPVSEQYQACAALEPAPTPAAPALPDMLPIMDRNVRTPIGQMRRPSKAASAAFAFRVRGSALEASGILPGDLLFVDAVRLPRHMAVVLLSTDDDRVIVRRIIPGGKVTRFVASPGVPEMVIGTADAQRVLCGVATGLFRPSEAISEACAA